MELNKNTMTGLTWFIWLLQLNYAKQDIYVSPLLVRRREVKEEIIRKKKCIRLVLPTCERRNKYYTGHIHGFELANEFFATTSCTIMQSGWYWSWPRKKCIKSWIHRLEKKHPWKLKFWIEFCFKNKVLQRAIGKFLVSFYYKQLLNLAAVEQ